ncbi:MAG: polysaccharide biosynthesis tyrosine autokinase [Sedimentisphaerales bacterium]|nr:polysaccharide biosynthesis tyrosine autokinase [Sedimentisphaerales bacterium]
MISVDSNSGQPERLTGNAPLEPMTSFTEGLFAIVWRRRWTVLVTTVVILVAGFFYLQRATPLYESTSRVYVEQIGPQVFEKDNTGVITRWSNYLYTQAELLASTSILSNALKRMDASSLRTFQDASNPIAALRQGLDINVGKNDEIINVSFKTPYPEESAHIVNKVVDAYIAFNEERNRDTSGEIVQILREEKTKRDQELVQKLKVMMQFKQDNEGLAFGTDQDNNVIVRRLERLSAALTEAQLYTVECKSFYEVADQMKEDPAGLKQLVEAQRSKGVYISTSNEASSVLQELREMQRQKHDYLRQYKSDSPALTVLNQEIDWLKEEIARLDKEFAQSQLAVAQQQYQASLEREKELMEYFEQQRQEAVLLNNQLTEFAILQSDYEQTKKLCDLLDDRIKRLDVAKDVGTLNISIIETAEPAVNPAEPQKARVLGLALFIGLASGVGVALGKDMKDQRLHSIEEITGLLKLPVLGTLPAMTSPKQTVSIRGQKVHVSPDSREAEAFRTLRTAICFGAPKEEARVILVTSPAPGEGKTTVASNLGIALGQTGQKVLIMDADFRRPSQDKVFNLDRKEKGLSSVLAGELELEEAIEHTGLNNLDVLICGPSVPNPAEILDSRRFRAIVDELSKQYDRLIIDSPPVIAVTDALILAAQSDVTLLVVRAESSTRKISMQARESLNTVNARILGVVVNDVSTNGSSYGYYTQYSYYYRTDEKGMRKKNRKKMRSSIPIADLPEQRTKGKKSREDEIVRQ